jgi:hypothetical protein
VKSKKRFHNVRFRSVENQKIYGAFHVNRTAANTKGQLRGSEKDTGTLWKRVDQKMISQLQTLLGRKQKNST